MDTPLQSHGFEVVLCQVACLRNLAAVLNLMARLGRSGPLLLLEVGISRGTVENRPARYVPSATGESLHSELVDSIDETCTTRAFGKDIEVTIEHAGS